MLNNYLANHLEAVRSVDTNQELKSAWHEADNILFETLSKGRCIYIAGNGGSAADAQHFAGEIVGRFVVERRGYPAIALSTDSSVLTAIGNDYGFEKVFSRQLDALAREGDCFVAISTSGNSQNILEALKVASDKGIKSILLSGKDGGAAKDIANVAIVIPSEVTAHIQEMHQIFYHCWCASLDVKLKS